MKKIIYTLLLFVIQLQIVRAQSNWQSIGPVNRTGGNGQGSGRIYSIAHHPQYNGTTVKTIFAASPYGGVWISKDAGNSWSNDDPDYPGLSTDKLNGCGVMDIIIDYTNPYVMYAASYHHTGVNFANGYMGTSAGIYKYNKINSNMGGWVASGLYWPYPSSKQLYKLTMHPTNSQVLLAGTSDGIYRSADGGGTWSTVFTYTTTNNYGFKNIVFRPGSTTEVYASADKVFKSTDAGVTWAAVPNFPVANANWVDIAVTPTGNFYCYFLVGQTSYFYYYTTSWAAKATYPITMLEYNIKRLTLQLHPTNSNIVYSGQEVLHRYNLTANTWTAVSTYNGDMHADMHEIAFSPNNTELWIGHDGGISMANTNLTSGTPNWSTKNTGLRISTIYSFAGSPKEPTKYLAGEEDNGDSYYNGGTWQGYQVSDGGDKMIDYDNSNNWYDRMEMYAGKPIYRNTTGVPGYFGTGITTVFDQSTNQPFLGGWSLYEDFGLQKLMIQDPRNPNVIYRAGFNALWRSSNYGASSESILQAAAGGSIEWGHLVASVAIAPTNTNYIYVTAMSKYDRNITDKVLVTHNALSCPYLIYNTSTNSASCSDPGAAGAGCSNSCWTDITPAWPGGYTTAQLSLNNISTVAVSDKDPERIWIGYKRISAIASDRTPYQIKMRENGVWSDYNEGLPVKADIYSLLYERGSNDGLYAATTAGLYYRNASSGEWTLFDTNLPQCEVKQMEINYTDNTIRAGLYGRGIWKSQLQCPTTNTLTLTNMSPAPMFHEAHSIISGNAIITTNPYTIFRATKSITLNPKFIADASSGGYFLGYIHGCSGPGNSLLKTNNDEFEIITEEDDEEEEYEYEKMKEHAIQALPNPSNGVLTLMFQDDDEKNVSIYDMMGKIVFKAGNVKGNRLQINITDQPAGVYLIKVISGDEIISKKVIKH